MRLPATIRQRCPNDSFWALRERLPEAATPAEKFQSLERALLALPEARDGIAEKAEQAASAAPHLLVKRPGD